jgi:hypothetical protein
MDRKRPDSNIEAIRSYTAEHAELSGALMTCR